MFNPFKPIDASHDNYTVCVRDGDTGAFYQGIKDGDKLVPSGPPLGYALALSTVHNVRGIDLSDVDMIIFDEYCPEPHERGIRNEYEAFLNAMETIGRNRELQGKPPVQFVGLTNANQLGNPYFLGMGVIRVVDKMIKTGREIWTDKDRGLLLCNITGSPISTAKSKTALYRLAGSGEFAEMSLGNQFSLDYCTRQGSVPLVECRPVVAVGELCIYQHKTNRRLWYVCDHVSGSPEKYPADDTGLKRFRAFHSYLFNVYLDGDVVFQDILAEILFRKYFNE